jgi:hypothetical protein
VSLACLVRTGALLTSEHVEAQAAVPAVVGVPPLPELTDEGAVTEESYLDEE